MKRFCTQVLVLFAFLFSIIGTSAEATEVYSENFEDDDGGFTHSGTNDCWEWGTPDYWITSAGEGSKCWGTNLTGTYVNSSSFSLSSPTIDLTRIPSNHTLTLKWKRAKYIEHYWDNAFLYLVPETGSPVTLWSHNWEDSVSSGWTELTADISAFAGTRFHLRWDFGSDGSVFYAGLYIDDIRIETLEPLIYTVTASADVHGTVSPDIASVDAGENLTVSITPDEGYQIDYLTIDISGDITPVFPASPDHYTLENVSDDISLMAYFAFDREMLADSGLDNLNIDDLRFALSLPGFAELPDGVASNDYAVFDFAGVGSPVFSTLTSEDVSDVPEIQELFLLGLSFDLAAEASSDAELPVLVTDMVLVVSRDVLGEDLCASIDAGDGSEPLAPVGRENIADDFFRYVRLYKIIEGTPYDLYALGQDRDSEEEFFDVYSDESAYYLSFTMALVDRGAGEVPPIQALADENSGFFFIFDGEADGHFRDPLVLGTMPEKASSGSGGSCNVGFSPALALLFLPLLGLLKKQ